MQGLLDFLKSLGAARLAAMGAVTLALIGFFAFVMMQMTAPVMVPLFTDLSVEDSGAIIKDLDRQAIDYKIKNDGAIIMVPKDKVARLRMKLAESGLPKGGGVGYEIFDKSDALGATSFIQNINHLRALEGELARTIRSIDRVQAARVHLVLPERPLFSRDKVEATASIVLKVRGQLEPAQVRAIRHLVASAVNGLKPDRVSVVDETGRLLADGASQDNPLAAGADERKVAFENRLRNEVENIVSSVVGPGKARVQVSADFDFNRITQTQDKFDPDSRVLRSSQTREEQNTSSEGKEGGQVSAANELPGASKDGTNNNGPNSKDQSTKTEEIVNSEISRTTKPAVIEAGRLSRVSAAVLVDGRYAKNDKGEMVYEPRSKEEIDRIAALVRTAIGFDAKRGDQVEVVNLRFADQAPISMGDGEGGWSKYFQFTKDDIMGMAEKGVMALLGLIVVLMVVRPLVRRVIAPDAAEKARLAGLAGVAGAIGGPGMVPGSVEIGPDGNPLPTITDTSGTNIAIVSGEEQVAISNRTSAMIDVAKVQGQVHAQSVQKVGELAEKNPHEAVAIIRSWLHEDAA